LIWKASFILYHELVLSILERDFELFARSLALLQETIGEIFSVFQGGAFTHYSQKAISVLKELGVLGVGQSSWGPAVYGVLKSREEAEEVARKAVKILGEDTEVFIARPVNRGVLVKIST